MFMFIFKIWYMIVVLPFLIFIEGSKMFGNFLKKKNIYAHWDIFHAFLFVLLVLFLILWLRGYR